MRKRIKSLIVTAVATVMAITSLSISTYAASGGANGANAEQFGAEPVLGQNYTYKVYSSTTGFDSDARAMVAVAIANIDGSYTAYYPASSTVKTYFFTTGLIGVPYEESKVEIEKAKICLHFIIVYDILIVLVIANSVISISYTAMVDSAISIRTRNIQLREDF